MTKKLLLEIEEEYRMKYSEIEFQDSQFDAATELLIRNAIWDCFPELQTSEHNKYRKEFDLER
ncbi:hypothetical protein KA013_02430 [Patescibacteria group bacterium]|nr:hypothetical protein [Patescibacteria group bacterium]